MKLFINAVALFFLTSLFSCSNTAGVSQPDNATIKEEVKHTMDNVLQFASQAQLDSALTYFDTSADFTAIDEGRWYDYGSFRQLAKEEFSMLKSQTFTKKQEQIKIYRPDLVLYLFTASVDERLKNDSVMHMNDFGGSFLLQKKEGQWKIIFSHQSVPSPEEAVQTSKN